MNIPSLIDLRVVWEKTLFLEFSDWTKGEVIIDFPKGSFMDKKLSNEVFFNRVHVAESGRVIQRDEETDIDATAQRIALTGNNPFLVSEKV